MHRSPHPDWQVAVHGNEPVWHATSQCPSGPQVTSQGLIPPHASVQVEPAPHVALQPLAPGRQLN
jgi:hypothetical protein